MGPTENALFAVAERRLAWAEQRQALLAQNIANASRPGYQPRDMPSFSSVLSGQPAAEPAQTQPGHLRGTSGGAFQADPINQPTARSPDGNSVSIDEQLTKVADTETTQSMVTAIYKKYMSLFGLALGHSS